MSYTPEQREQAIAAVVAGLREGTPLTVICSAEGMPCDDTVRNWASDDETLSRAIARARDTGFDTIAMQALAIADDRTNDTISTAEGDRPNTEWVTRSRLRVDTRLKLLAKWDPKRYGERITHAGDAENPVEVRQIVRKVVDPSAPTE